MESIIKVKGFFGLHFHVFTVKCTQDNQREKFFSFHFNNDAFFSLSIFANKVLLLYCYKGPHYLFIDLLAIYQLPFVPCYLLTPWMFQSTTLRITDL